MQEVVLGVGADAGCARLARASGDRVRCVVIRIDSDDGSISLSTKMLEDRPGEMIKNATMVFERARQLELSQEADPVTK